jgi:hypothetical protein
MSDRAREYVKRLKGIPWPIKSFLFLIADYENEAQNCGWAGRARLAEDMEKDESRVKELFRAAAATGEITYLAGRGRGNFGKFVFVRMLAQMIPAENEGAKGAERGLERGGKGAEKGRFEGGAIRKNLEPGTENQEQERGEREKSPRYTQSDFDERDNRKLQTELNAIYLSLEGARIVDSEYEREQEGAANSHEGIFYRACARAGVPVERGMKLTGADWKRKNPVKNEHPHGCDCDECYIRDRELRYRDTPVFTSKRDELIRQMGEIRGARRNSGIQQPTHADEEDFILELVTPGLDLTKDEARRLLATDPADAGKAAEGGKRPPQRAAVNQ